MGESGRSGGDESQRAAELHPIEIYSFRTLHLNNPPFESANGGVFSDLVWQGRRGNFKDYHGRARQIFVSGDQRTPGADVESRCKLAKFFALFIHPASEDWDGQGKALPAAALHDVLRFGHEDSHYGQ